MTSPSSAAAAAAAATALRASDYMRLAAAAQQREGEGVRAEADERWKGAEAGAGNVLAMEVAESIWRLTRVKEELRVEEELQVEEQLRVKVAESIWRLTLLVATPAVGAWKVQEVAMVLNGLARVELEVPPPLLQHLAAVVVGLDAQRFGALNAASIANALARLPCAREALSEELFETLMRTLRDAARAGLNAK